MDERVVESPRRDSLGEPVAPVTTPRQRCCAGHHSAYLDPALLVTIPTVLALDQLTKALIREAMEIGQSWPADGFFRFTYGTNSGSAFGLFQNYTGLLIVASAIAIGFLIFFYKTYSPPSALLRLAIGLQLGGAVGNLVDRIRVGAVVDFIDVGPWPIFNLADSAVVVGMAMLAVVLLTGKAGRASGREAAAGAVSRDDASR